MQIDSGIEIYKLVVSGLMFCVGVLNAVGISILRGLKKNDETLFGRVNRTDQKVTQAATQIENIIEDIREIKTICREHHR